MQPFLTLKAVAAPLARSNVDTEVIIPITRLIEFPRGQLGPYAFEPWRYHASGTLDHSFVLNQPRYANASILVAGDNFGCGSSREHAVWALWDMGFRVIIAPSFGDIFRANAFQNGLLTITLPERTTEALINDIEGLEQVQLKIDLEASVITTDDGETIGFAIDRERRIALLEGLDEIGLTLKFQHDIDDFRTRDLVARPWAYNNNIEDDNV